MGGARHLVAARNRRKEPGYVAPTTQETLQLAGAVGLGSGVGTLLGPAGMAIGATVGAGIGELCGRKK